MSVEWGGSYNSFSLRPIATQWAARLTDAFRSVGRTRRGTASWLATSGMSSGRVPLKCGVTRPVFSGDRHPSMALRLPVTGCTPTRAGLQAIERVHLSLVSPAPGPSGR